MLVGDKYGDLKRMYGFFQGVDGLSTIKETVISSMLDAGKQLTSLDSSSMDPISFVQDFLQLKDKYDEIINKPNKKMKINLRTDTKRSTAQTDLKYRPKK